MSGGQWTIGASVHRGGPRLTSSRIDLKSSPEVLSAKVPARGGRRSGLRILLLATSTAPRHALTLGLHVLLRPQSLCIIRPRLLKTDPDLILGILASGSFDVLQVHQRQDRLPTKPRGASEHGLPSTTFSRALGLVDQDIGRCRYEDACLRYFITYLLRFQAQSMRARMSVFRSAAPRQ